MTLLNRQFWIATLRRRRSPASQNRRASAARCVAGRHARRTSGSASVGIHGTLSTLAVSALRAFTSGLKLNAYRAADGRGIRIGIPSSCVQSFITS